MSEAIQPAASIGSISLTCNPFRTFLSGDGMRARAGRIAPVPPASRNIRPMVIDRP
jgi:hypothetical protein